MRTVRNVGHIRSRKRIAKWGALLGFALLLSTFFLALQPRLIGFAYLLLFAGFLLFNFGMQQVGKWSRSPRNDQAIDSRLNGLNDRYTVVHYAKIGKRVVEHLVLHPGGVLVLAAREVPGDTEVKGGRWRRRGGMGRRLFGFSGPQVGNPSLELRDNIKAVEEQLAASKLETDVIGAVVFLHPGAVIHAEQPEYPILLSDELADFVRSLPPDPTLHASEREALVTTLAGGGELEAAAQRRTRRPVRKRAA